MTRDSGRDKADTERIKEKIRSLEKSRDERLKAEGAGADTSKLDKEIEGLRQALTD